MTIAGARLILAQYAKHGFHLVPIPAGCKGPVTKRWNVREMTVTDPEIAQWLDGNVGLAHAYSGTAALDIDDLAGAKRWFSERGIDLDALLGAPDAVRIESRANRSKLLYRVDKPLPSFKLAGFELRCASGSGTTLQDVLPPSIHPDTKQPYRWAYGSPAGHWSKLPALPVSISTLWLSLISSKALPTPKRAAGIEAEKLRTALEPLDPDCSYDDWLTVGMVLHYETGGGGVGLALWNEWSARGKKYRGMGDLETHWRTFRVNHDRPLTIASLRRETVASADDFPDIDSTVDMPSIPSGRAVLGVSADGRDKALEALRGLRRSRMGTIEARISNIVSVLAEPAICGQQLAFDAFQDVVQIAPHGSDAWRSLQDTDYTALRCWLETAGNCEPISHDMMRHAVLAVAQQHSMDSALIWLSALEWDGVNRIDRFMPRYCGTSDTAYERGAGAYLWTAMAGRVLSPGCQADMVPVFIGRQGVGKSRGVQALVPDMQLYAELRLDESDDVIARKMRGVLVGELAEMRGARTGDLERVKAFVTRTFEKWTPKYQEFAHSYARRFIIVGTTNDEEFLPTDTEHRRWLPLLTEKIDVVAIARDRALLWAEGRERYKAHGVAWQGLDLLAYRARRDAEGVDLWEADITHWLADHKAPYVRMADVLSQALGIDLRSTTRIHELRAGRVLRQLAYVRRTVAVGGKDRIKAWVFDPTS